MQVFDNDDFPPDAEFGCFQMVSGPPDTDFADEALLRLDVGEASSKICCDIYRPSSSLPCYGLKSLGACGAASVKSYWLCHVVMHGCVASEVWTEA